MSKAIKVIMRDDGRTVREINPLGEMPKQKIESSGIKAVRAYLAKFRKWDAAERRLKVYEIEFGQGEVFHKYNKRMEAFRYANAGEKLKGKVLPSGRIKIIVK
jgi:hypothetical protein